MSKKQSKGIFNVIFGYMPSKDNFWSFLKWIGGFAWNASVAFAVLTTPLIIYNDVEKVSMANLLAIAYSIKPDTARM